MLLAQISTDKEDNEPTHSKHVGRNTGGFNDKCRIDKKNKADEIQLCSMSGQTMSII